MRLAGKKRLAAKPSEIDRARRGSLPGVFMVGSGGLAEGSYEWL